MIPTAPTCRPLSIHAQLFIGLSLSLVLGTALAQPGLAQDRPAVSTNEAGVRPQVLTPPENRYNLTAWMEYQRQARTGALPAIAQLFYRRGLETLESGAREDGIRMLRGASQLDPAFLAPRVALVRHFALSDPS